MRRKKLNNFSLLHLDLHEKYKKISRLCGKMLMKRKKTLKSIFEVAVKREKICEAVCENIQIGSSSSSSSSTIIDMIIFLLEYYTHLCNWDLSGDFLRHTQCKWRRHRSKIRKFFSHLKILYNEWELMVKEKSKKCMLHIQTPPSRTTSVFFL